MPLDETIYGHEQIAPFVANLLPEGDDLRGRLERLLHIDKKDDFGLLGAIGRESAGALSFWYEGESPQDNEQRYSTLSLEEFREWREFAHQQPFQFRGQTFRMSLAGAQVKTALYFDSDWAQFAIECGFTAAFVRRRARELAKHLSEVLPHTTKSVVAQYPVAQRAANAVGDGVTQQINMILSETSARITISAGDLGA